MGDGCVYMKEADGDANEYCFKPSSTYTAECQDDGVTGEQGVELPEDYSTTNNMGDHSKPTQGVGEFCDFTAIDNVVEGREYTVAGIETSRCPLQMSRSGSRSRPRTARRGARS